MTSEQENIEGVHEFKAAVIAPLPKIQVFCICTVQMAEAMNVDLLFPFLAFMVEDMGYTGEQLGYHAGILAAAFCGAQFCTSIAWGMISDRYGRKLAIVLGTLGAGIGMLMFGLSKTFAQAMIGRIIGGFLCGNLGVAKSFLTEVTDDSNRSVAFYSLSLSWAVGSVFAPLAGGMLCKPAEKYPSIFPPGPNSIWVEYPYLLPCLVTLSWSVISSILCMVYMIETVGASKEEIQARIRGIDLPPELEDHSLYEYGEQEVEMSNLGASAAATTGPYSRIPEVDMNDASLDYVEKPYKSSFGSNDTGETTKESYLETPEYDYAGTDADDAGVDFSYTGSGSGGGGGGRGVVGADRVNEGEHAVGDYDETGGAYHDQYYEQTCQDNAKGNDVFYSKEVYNSSSNLLQLSRPEDLDHDTYHDNSNPTSAPNAEAGGTNDLRTPRAVYYPLSSVPEEAPVESGWEVDETPTPTVTTAGVSTALSYGRVRNRSRSSSNVGPYDFADLEQQQQQQQQMQPAPPNSQQNDNSYHTAASDEGQKSDFTTVLIQEDDCRDDDQWDITGLDAAETGAATTADGYSYIDQNEEIDEICCLSAFKQAEALVAYLSCTSRSRAMDTSVHSSQQLLDPNDPSSGYTVANERVLVQRVVLIAILNFGLVCAGSILMDETLPLYMKLDAHEGGFGFDSGHIGMLLSTGAAGMMILTVVCMPLTSGISNKLLSWYSLGWSIPLSLAFPLIALLNNDVLVDLKNNTEHMWLLWPILILVNSVKNFITCQCFTSAIIMVNHSVTDEHLGKVNGFGQSIGSLARCMGPVIGGLLWSLGTRFNFVYLNFIAIAILLVLNMYVTNISPSSLDHKKKRRRQTAKAM